MITPLRCPTRKTARILIAFLTLFSSAIFLLPASRSDAASISAMLIDNRPEAAPIAAPLGMTLDTFRTMPFLDRAKYPQARVLCSGDAELRQSMALTEMRPMPDEAAAGIIRCNLFRPDPVNLSWWTPILPEVGGKPVKSTAYFFLPADNGGYRLLFIQAVLPDTLFEAAHAQFIDAYGTPKKRTEPGLITESLWTESWKMDHVWLLLDSRKHSFRRDFSVTYVSAALTETAATRGFDPNRNVLYYSAHTRFR